MTHSLSSLTVALLMTLSVASQALAQVGQPVDPAELLRDGILINEKRGIEIRCLGTDADDSIKVTCFQDRIVISLNEMAETVFVGIGDQVTVKICGFDGNDYLGVNQHLPFLPYQIDGVLIDGGSGDDELYAAADAPAALIGGLGSDYILSNCDTSLLMGDASWYTTLGNELAVDFSSDTVIGLGPQPTFVRIAVGFRYNSNVSWELFDEDRTNEDSNNPNDVLTLFAEVNSDDLLMLFISDTDNEDWKAHLPR